MDILGHVHPLEDVETVEVLDALGRVLARDVHSDVDLPPFQKSAMDGFAVRSADFGPQGLASGVALEVLGESRAGVPYAGSVAPGQCVEIYTGAQVPDDCDAVVMVEKSLREGQTVRFDGSAQARQNVCNQGEDLTSGALALASHRRLSPTDLSVLAAVGCSPVPVFRRPRVSILTTGDELVAPHETPGVGQIREGNTLHLAALTAGAGAQVIEVGLVADRSEELEARFAAALAQSDVVITTGGVSMGKYDLVAQVFRKLGVREVFHKVAVKPGKPIWFGVQDSTLVFGLPGNPVSCLVDQEVFVRPALAKLGNAPQCEWGEGLRRGRWDGAEMAQHPRQRYVPVRVCQGEDGVDQVSRLDWSSSADIVGLAEADGLALVPAGTGLPSGGRVSYRPLPRP